MMRRRMVLSSLAAALVALAAALVAFGVVRSRLVDRSQAELNRQATATAKIIDQQLEGAARQSRGLALGRTVDQLRLLGGHDYMEVGAVTDGGIEPLGSETVLLPLLPLPVPQDQPVEVEVDGEPVIATSREIGVGSRTWLVVIGRSEPLLVPGILTGPLVVGLVAGLVAALATAAVLARPTVRGIRRLGDATRRVADGDFSVRAPEDGGDEFAEFGRRFNLMAAELAATRERERTFLLDVGHDLRTPLTTIRGYVEGLEDLAIPPDDMPRVAGVLRKQTDRLGRLVEDLMLLARVEAREFSVRPEPVELAAHLREAIEAVRPIAQASGVRLEVDLADVGVISIDPDRIAQILGNLVDNALRWTPEAGTVGVRLEKRGEAVVLTVADTGPGMDPEDLPHIFERGYVGSRYRPVRPHGSGLGLSIVRGIVEVMGGRVAAASTPGRGTEIAVTIPAQPAVGAAVPV